MENKLNSEEELSRHEMIDSLVKKRYELFRDELDKYRNMLGGLEDEKLKKVFNTMVRYAKDEKLE